MLFDEDRIVAYRYGVLLLYDSRRVRVARTATFLVGPDGRIQFVVRGSREERCPVEKLIKVAAAETTPSSRCGDREGRSPEEVS